jgi:hypothetical protein
MTKKAKTLALVTQREPTADERAHDIILGSHRCGEKCDESSHSLKPHEASTSPALIAASVIDHWTKLGEGEEELNVSQLGHAIALRVDAVQRGDMAPVEAQLIAQSAMLEAMAASLFKRAGRTGELKSVEILMRLGLKAVSQSRCALEAVAEMKQPRQVMFAKQANLAQNQQINNGTPRAGDSEIAPNELLQDGEA